jgi:hypothetical protein
MFELIENFKEEKIINKGTANEYRYSNALFKILGTNDEEEVRALCDKLNTEKPAEYHGSKIDWDKISHFSYSKDVNKELIW